MGRDNEDQDPLDKPESPQCIIYVHAPSFFNMRGPTSKVKDFSLLFYKEITHTLFKKKKKKHRYAYPVWRPLVG